MYKVQTHSKKESKFMEELKTRDFTLTNITQNCHLYTEKEQPSPPQPKAYLDILLCGQRKPKETRTLGE